MAATPRERDEYRRAHVLTLATWEIQQVHAGERDTEVRRFIDERVAKEWSIKQLTATEWEYHDADRLRAILQKRPGDSPWVVNRVNSQGRLTGCDSFRTRADAHAFITDGRIFRKAQFSKGESDG